MSILQRIVVRQSNSLEKMRSAFFQFCSFQFNLLQIVILFFVFSFLSISSFLYFAFSLLNSQQCEVIGAVRKVNDDDNLEENRKKVWNYSDDFAKSPFISLAIMIFVVVNTYRQNNH